MLVASSPVLSNSSVYRLRFLSSSYMYSTSMAPQSVGSLIAALDVIESEPELRASLWSNIKFFRAGLATLGADTGRASAAIFPIIVGDDLKVKQLCRGLHEPHQCRPGSGLRSPGRALVHELFGR